MRAIGIDRRDASGAAARTDFFTSHEALLLGYEQAMTPRSIRPRGDWYATSGHMLWIGDRTRQPDHAHVEFCRGIKNPIGLKCGPSLDADELLRLIDILNPENEPGRLTLICRFGADKVDKHLPALIRAVQARGPHVVWSCDPMHGNTVTAATATRRGRSTASSARCEASSTCTAPRAPIAGGIHVEMTGQNVTECTGGARALSEARPADRYHTHCDPRLNADQALELAFLVAERLKQEREEAGRDPAPITAFG